MISPVSLLVPRVCGQPGHSASDQGFARLFGEAMAQPVTAALRPTFGADTEEPGNLRGDGTGLLPAASLAPMLAGFAAAAAKR